MSEKRKQLALQFTQFSHFLHHYRMRAHVDKSINPYRGQGRILTILKMQPEILQKELGYLLDISKQALAELINKLEKKGYIVREQSEEDRRSFVIKLTDKGRKAIDKGHIIDDDSVEQFFDCLNDEEQGNLIDYMERIMDNLKEEMGDGDDDFSAFYRERFFDKHRGQHDMFKGFFRLNRNKFGGFRNVHGR